MGLVNDIIYIMNNVICSMWWQCHHFATMHRKTTERFTRILLLNNSKILCFQGLERLNKYVYYNVSSDGACGNCVSLKSHKIRILGGFKG